MSSRRLKSTLRGMMRGESEVALMSPDITVDQFNVDPCTIDVYELDTIVTSREFFTFKPLYYKCFITLSPKVITEMIKWMHTNGFIEIRGSIRIKTSMSRRVLSDNS